MRTFQHLTLVFLFFFSSTGWTQKKPVAAAPDLPRQRLEKEVARLSQLSGGLLGVTALHVESGKRFSQNG